MKLGTDNKSNSAAYAGDGSLDMIPGTGWTYFDAAAMADELSREARLFPKHRHPVSMVRRSPLQRSAGFKARFLKRTGWSWDDAVEEAVKSQRKQRPSRLFV